MAPSFDALLGGFPALTDNLVTDTDSYKFSFEPQYPPGIQAMYQYFASRGGKFHSVMAVGLQGFVKKRLLHPVTKAMVDEAEVLVTAHGEPFYREGWDTLLDIYRGVLPVTIRALPEGTVAPVGTVQFDVELTSPDRRLFWLPTHIETAISRCWYPSAVGTTSWFVKRLCREALERSADNPEASLPFMLHDFGSRGASSEETARIGGFAHLVNFLGTDTVEALRYAAHYYGPFEGVAGYSIPAAEHSTMSMWGQSRERDAYRNFVQRFLVDRQLPPGVPKIAACVSDTWDVFNAVENHWCDPELHDLVRGSGGKLVIRPDSGNPVEVLLKILAIMERKIGMQTNLKGYKVLPPYFGIIQGDGCTLDSIAEILHAVMARGYSASNLAFGMGGGLLQKLDRDTIQAAYKCAAALGPEGWFDVSKNPVTDPNKRSRAGHQAVVRSELGKGYQTVRGPRGDDCLVPIYRNGRLLVDQTLPELRANATRSLLESL